MVWIAGLCVVIAIAIAAVIAVRRSASTVDETEPTPSPAKARPAEQPMSGLESALSDVTDRDGRPIGERIDAGAQHVDDLRIPDDTGPLLRRALDHVESTGDTPANGVGPTEAGDRGERSNPTAPTDSTDEHD